MRTVIEQLPKAIRWSNTLMWFAGIATVFLIIGGVIALLNEPAAGIAILLVALFMGIQFWMMRNYKNACKEAFDSEHASDVELACKAQNTLVKFYGILALIAIVLIILGIVAAIAMPSYLMYLQR